MEEIKKKVILHERDSGRESSKNRKKYLNQRVKLHEQIVEGIFGNTPIVSISLKVE